MTALVIGELTAATIDGTGTFDVLMRSVKAHLDEEFLKGRIRGPEYSTVYLGSLDLVMQASLSFLLQKRKNDLEAQLLEKQILLVTQQTLNAAKEALEIEAKTALLTEQLATEVLRNFIHPTDPTLSGNFDMERQVLKAQQCKLDAEFDLTQSQTLKSAQEILLLAQKVTTEKAQTMSLGVDADSVVGKQKALYAAQTAGFARDAEQKVADIMTKTWSVRRTTDEATVADGTNLLNDVAVGRAVTKLLSGVGA